MNLALFLVGLAALLQCSDWFIDAANDIARRLRVSELVIGLTVVSAGTSLPELATNIYASFTGHDTVAYGNVVGSNITNVLLILGCGVVLMRSIDVPHVLFYQDGIMMILMSLLTYLSARFFGGLPVWGGLLFVILFVFYMTLLLRRQKKENKTPQKEAPAGSPRFSSIAMALVVLLSSSVGISLGAKAIVDNAIWCAARWGVPEAVIAVTAVALGTSLPELTVTVTGVLKKHNGIALGNIIGSNIFNLQLILGVSALINPLKAAPEILNFNLPFLLISDAMLLIFLRSRWKLNTWEGIAFLGTYVVFLFMNFSV